ncbi:MAG: sulfotransferase domain-containing protein [Geminicoccaceae bacterium]
MKKTLSDELSFHQDMFGLRQFLVDSTKRLVDVGTRRQLKLQIINMRQKVLPYGRPFPHFLIIGAMRAGTSSLFKYLDSNPDTAASLRKEIGFFTRYWAFGPEWYRAHFPITGSRLAFEATPDYLMHPLAPKRAADMMPNAKIIILLREPAARAHSHYKHMVRLGFEKRTFDQALSEEDQTIKRGLDYLGSPEEEEFKEFLRFSYIMRGHYADQLQAWLEKFPKKNVTIIWSEDLFKKTSETLKQISDFLEIDSKKFSNISRNYSAEDKGTAKSKQIKTSDFMPDWALERLNDKNQQLKHLLRSEFRDIKLPNWLQA